MRHLPKSSLAQRAFCATPTFSADISLQSDRAECRFFDHAQVVLNIEGTK